MTIDLGPDDNLFEASASNDTVDGEAGNDTIAGLDGDDSLSGAVGDDALDGDLGNDTLNGDLGDDLLLGDAGLDVIVGGDGDDRLNGEAEADSLEGGVGNDRVSVDGQDAGADGGAGDIDTLVILDNAGAIVSIDLGNAANQNASGAGPVLRGFEAVDATRASAAVSVIGAAFAHGGTVVLGSEFNDTQAGGTAADILFGGAGADALLGDGANDTLFGGLGNDSLGGGDGTLDVAGYGGNIADYRVEQAGDTVTVTDLNPADGDDGVDQLSGIELLQFANGSMTVGGAPANQAPTDIALSASAAAENAAGAVIGTLRTVDPDLGDTHGYSIRPGGDGGRFTIVGNQLRVGTAGLDFEAGAIRSVTIRATDQGGLFFDETFTITVADANEAPDASDATFAIAENAANGTVVGVVAASDPDAGGALTFAITNGNTNGAFAVNPASGQITVANTAALNREFIAAFTLSVLVTDQGSLSDTATVIVNLADVNEAPTANDATFTVAENAAPTTFVGNVAAVDPDAGDTLTYAITDGNTGLAFTIDPSSGVIAVNNSGPLDPDINPVFSLIVSVTDSGSLTDTATVVVNFSAVSGPPSLGDATSSIAENLANGTLVGPALTATDPDGGTIVFAIIGGNTNGAFSIEPASATTARLRVADAAVLDFESNPVFTLQLRVTDSDALTDTATVIVNLTNVNEAPDIVPATFAIPENSANGTTIGTAAATDPDAVDALTYSIIAGNTGGGFAINASTGQITVANGSALDFETTPGFTLTVRVADAGSLSDTATIVINLTDLAEGGGNQPPVANDASFALPENSAIGAAVGTVSASDPNPGDTLAYAITGGNGGTAFAIGSGGTITVASSSAINFEATPTFNLTVTVTDNGTGSLTDTAAVTIALTNVNEAPVATDASFTLAENSANATVVGTVTATDPDAGTTLAYAITAGNTGTAFAIDTAGTITVAASSAVDFETNPTFTLTVTVTDNGAGSLTDTANIVVQLTDGADTITGDGNDNVLTGFAGRESISGLGGNDTLKGAGGNDTLDGGAGSADLLDFSDATAGIALILAQGAGPNSTGDLSAAGLGTDSYGNMEGVVGGSGNDTLTGSSGDDSIVGGNGNDSLDAGAGNDTLADGNGADSVNGGPGNDAFVAGPGNDTYVGGGGSDSVQFLFGAVDVSVNLVTGTAAAGGDTDSLTDINNVIADAGNDSIRGNSAPNLIACGGGNDTVDAGGENDTIDGGDGDDSINSGSGNDTVSGGNGNDDFEGSGGDDLINGGKGSDTIEAGSGSDTLNGEDGDDVIGGDEHAAPSDDTYDGGNGNDDIHYVFTTAGVVVDLVNGTATGSEIGTDSLNDIENLLAGEGNDSVAGDGKANQFEGHGGNDTLTGGNGGDSLLGDDGDDLLVGGNGNDSLEGGAGADDYRWTLASEFGDFIVDFDAGTDSTTVDRLAFAVDTLPIGNGDSISGGAGNFVAGNEAALLAATSAAEILVKTDAAVANQAAAQAKIDLYGGTAGISTPTLFVFLQTNLGNAVIYHDPDPSAVGGASLVAELNNITTIGGLANFGAGDFLFQL